jgi:hypothetical protein
LHSDFLAAYVDPPDDALLAIIGKAKARSLSDTEREQAATQMRARNATISPRGTEIRRLYEHWQRLLTKLITGKSTLYAPGADVFKLLETAEKYFKEPESKNTAFNEPVPVRGAWDSKIVTYLLELLELIADA